MLTFKFKILYPINIFQHLEQVHGKEQLNSESKSEDNTKIGGEQRSRILNLTRDKLVCTFDSNCSYTTSSDIKMSGHINGKHKGDPKPFHCEDCVDSSNQYMFGSVTRYHYHRKKFHSTSEPNIMCDVCKKIFIVRSELKKVRIKERKDPLHFSSRGLFKIL